MKDNIINRYIGVEYKKGSNCNDLIYSFSDSYRQIIDQMNNSLFYKMDKKMLDIYEEIDFDKREKDCIIFFKDKNKKAWNHVAIFVDKNNILQNEETKFGSKIDNINLMLFRNFDYKIFKEKGDK